MVTTNTEVIGDTFTAAIVAMDPSMTYKGAERWKPSKRKVSGSATTRHFRIQWGRPGIRLGGIYTSSQVECEAECVIETDYAGDHSELQHVIIEDFHQLCEVLAALKGPSNGIMVVERDEPYYEQGDESSDYVRVEHTFTVRYLRAR